MLRVYRPLVVFAFSSICRRPELLFRKRLTNSGRARAGFFKQSVPADVSQAAVAFNNQNVSGKKLQSGEFICRDFKSLNVRQIQKASLNIAHRKVWSMKSHWRAIRRFLNTSDDL